MWYLWRMQIVIVVVALVVIAFVTLTVRLVRLQRHSAPSHCYGRALSTLISEQEELTRSVDRKSSETGCCGTSSVRSEPGVRWLASYVKYRLRPKHKVVALDANAGEGVDELRTGADGSTCLAITGDWADGSADSTAVAAAIERVDADYTTHLGDIYSVGSEREIERRFVGKAKNAVAWPLGKFGGLAVPGNHEYHSGAHAFYKLAMGDYLGFRDDRDSTMLPQMANILLPSEPALEHRWP